MKRRVVGLLAALILASGLQMSAGAEDLTNDYILGNSSLNLLNGGVFSEEDLNIEDYTGGASYSSINVFTDHIYYVADDTKIVQVDRSSGESTVLYQAEAVISRMFVVNDKTAYFVQNGNAYTYDFETKELMALQETGDVQSVIPTPYGEIYERGEAFHWDVYAGENQVFHDIYQCYTEDGNLIVTMDHKEYQVSLERLFAEDFSSADLSEYVYETTPESEISLHSEEDGICEECEKNAKNFTEADYEASLAAEPGEEATASDEVSAYAMSDLSKEQQNIVNRAEEQAKVTWTPLKNVSGWDGDYTFRAGKTYTGIPYGQPVYAKYVPYDASIAEFRNAVKDGNSKFYTDRSTFNASAPYYSSDCSGFVSWAWGLSSRHYTGSIASAGKRISGTDSEILYKLQVGDMLLKAGSHVVLVEDVVYKSGQLKSLTIIEQTPPIIKRTVYGQGGTKTLQQFLNYYHPASSYLAYRSNKVTDDNKNSSDAGNGPVVDTTPHVVYSTHVQTYGWQAESKDGETSGTIGESKRLEAIKISLKNYGNVSVTYRTHAQTYGWLNWVKDGSLSGTVNESKRLEAIEIKLEGTDASKYDIYYRAYAQTYGWLGWAKNGESAGTKGLSKRLEAIQIKVVPKGSAAPGSTDNRFVEQADGAPSVEYQTHVQTYGWQNVVKDGATAGTSGESKRLEGIKINVANNSKVSVKYRTHVQTYGWMDWVTAGHLSGTSGESKRLEAIQIELTGTDKDKYDIYYRVHAQTYGWLGWAKNGESAGTEGAYKRLEAIQIKIVEKGKAAPGSTSNHFVKLTSADLPQLELQFQTHVQTYGWTGLTTGTSGTSGTSGQSKRLEAIKIRLLKGDSSSGIEYRTHVQTYGWQSWAKNGALSGTSGESKRLEAIQIKLTGTAAQKYDIYYRVHSQTYGWLGWAKNGESAGTEGKSKRLEAIQIKLVNKGGVAPTSTTSSFVK